jgi:uncharacterized protein (TIGR04222 family)
MEGLNFLVFYGLLVVGSVVGLYYLRSRLDQSDRLSIPSIPVSIDPFETAYLRGGPNELARTVLFSLRQKGAVTLYGERKATRIRPAPRETAGTLSEVEEQALNWLGGGRDAKETFRGDSTLVHALARYGDAYRRSLEKRQLLIDSDQAAKLRTTRVFVILAIVGLGLLGLFLENPGSQLIGSLGLLGSAGAYVAGRIHRVSKLGKRYLERLRIAFDRVGGQITDRTAGDPLLVAVGVFGSVALAGTSYVDFSNVYGRGKRERDGAASAGCGGCGSACSSCCSCSGGGSCGGGGCGGGCGGS